MPQHITDTTQLKCDKGTALAPIAVTSQTFMQIEGKLQATEEDKQPNVNIKPFGVCSVTRSSCVPAPIKWKDTSVFEIDGKKELLDNSTCQCSVGGKISIIKSAQSFVEEAGESIYQPIVYTPDDESDDKYNGYYYNYNGSFEGKVAGQKNGNESDVYACDGKGKEKDTFVNAKKLKITHTDFQRVCNIVKYEGLSTEKEEYLYIAHTNYNEAKRVGKSMLTLLNSSYSSVETKNKVPMEDTAKDSRSLYSRTGVIDALLREVDSNKKDPTDNATQWDGEDFLAWGIDTDLKPDSNTKYGHNKFDEYNHVKISKKLYDSFVLKVTSRRGSTLSYPTIHDMSCKKGKHIHKQLANGKKKAIYDLPNKDFSRAEYWKTGDFYYTNKSKQSFGLEATCVAGYTIFWKKVKI